MSSLVVVSTGPLALVQDLGRPGLAGLGVGASGAMDRGAHRLANARVGNAPGAATLEVLLGGLRLRAAGQVQVAVAGAGVDDEGAGRSRSVLLRDREIFEVPVPTSGLRTYVAVRGGFDAPAVLGSRARDTLASIGPLPLEAGDVLAVGEGDGHAAAQRAAGARSPRGTRPPAGAADASALLTLILGPRADWFDADALRSLFGRPWRVSARADRTGIRLEGPVLGRSALGAAELPSEGMVPGSLQVSPDGAPTILGVDAPVTGGYPVIAVVASGDLDALAQLRPGQAVRFAERDPAWARRRDLPASSKV